MAPPNPLAAGCRVVIGVGGVTVIVGVGINVGVVLVLFLLTALVITEVVMVVVCRREVLELWTRSNGGPPPGSALPCAHRSLTGRRSQTRRWTGAAVAAPPTGRPRSWRRRRAAWRGLASLPAG